MNSWYQILTRLLKLHSNTTSRMLLSLDIQSGNAMISQVYQLGSTNTFGRDCPTTDQITQAAFGWYDLFGVTNTAHYSNPHASDQTGCADSPVVSADNQAALQNIVTSCETGSATTGQTLIYQIGGPCKCYCRRLDSYFPTFRGVDRWVSSTCYGYTAVRRWHSGFLRTRTNPTWLGCGWL